MKRFNLAHQPLLIILSGLIVMGSLIFALTGSNERFAQNAALETARSYSQTFTSIRNFYQVNVVERLEGTNAQIVHNFREVEGAVPIPATMMIELTSFLNQSNTDVTFALISDFPFPWRANRPLVDFDIKALRYFREAGENEFYEFRTENDTVYLHYARPVIMGDGCVGCHNSHPESPKTDWKVGDVRAIQIFELPFQNAANDISFETSIFVAVIIVLSITTIFALLTSNLLSQKSQMQLKNEAHFDSLTGTMRRPRFQELYDHKNRGRRYFLAIVDIDDFKAFNTDFGHSAGDQVLREVAKSLSEFAKEAEVVCRYGGEEFVLLIDSDVVKGHSNDYFDKLVKSIAQKSFSISDRKIIVTVSIGYLPLEVNESLTKCAERADAALRYAKRNGKNQAVQADHKLLQSLGYLDQAYRTSDIENALCNDSIYFEFQPIINLSNGLPVAFEALVRMRLSEDEVAPPSAFLPQYISALRNTENAANFRKALLSSLESAASQLKQTKNLSFNLDPYDLVNNPETNCLIVVLKELVEEGYTIIIEIVETPYMDSISESAFVENLKSLKKMGFLIYMDDFGKEGSSLQRFLSFDFDAVKIDRSITAELGRSGKAMDLIAVLVEMARRGSFSIVVEGVETKEQEKMLVDLGINTAQGYLYC